VLIPDEGFRGLVIHIDFASIILEAKETVVRVTVGAGENWDHFVEAMVLRGLYGIENLSFIPGSVGASPVQNIGAYGVEVKDVLESVEVFDTETSQFKKLTKDECRLGYRSSLFKQAEGKKYIVTEVTFILKKTTSLSYSYLDLKDYFAKHIEIEPSLKTVRDAVISIRKAKLPDISLIGTAGSFFKNPILDEVTYQTLLRKYPNIPSFPSENNQYKIPAGWLIDKVGGWKGYRVGAVGVYEKQALVLVNYDAGTSNEVIKLAEMIEKDIKEKTNIILEREVCVL
jgi:UDP-N-acetylmuramate dehydrogenase